MMYWFDLENLDVENLKDLSERIESMYEKAEENWSTMRSLCDEIAGSERFHCENKEDAQKLGKILRDIDIYHSYATESLEVLKDYIDQLQETLEQGENNEPV
ncbi:hypothetical protein [Helicobacter salomonis]|uniref:hypothetical protein n=1 Tax=Helicobacter salomonis TaxID=56878 RepID=UPI0013158B83|nr:hypothetical protein [Helicobacter salomonis]